MRHIRLFALATLPTVFASPFVAPSTISNAQNETDSEPAPANFGQTINVVGLMERTDQDFVDGLVLDLFSPKNRTLVVTKNVSPLPGNFATGSTGAPFIALSNYSWVIKLNETANDLIAKIELPYDPVMLKDVGIDQGNTYVGTLSADKKSWVISESQRNVHVSENKTRIMKMTSLEGEYMLLGRKVVDISNNFVQYGQGVTRTVNVTGGAGIEESEFIDGLRFSVESEKAFTMNADIKNGVPQDVLPRDTTSLNSFSWIVNTSIPTQAIKNVDVRVPFNRAMIKTREPNATIAERRILVARRALNATSEKFEPLMSSSQKILASEDRIEISGLTQVDGQYVILVEE